LRLDRDKLQRAREMLGYSIEMTGEEAGVSKNSVLRAEHEEDIRPVTARKIAAALGVRVADLVEESETLKAQAPLPDFPVERREAAGDVALDAARRQAEHGRKAANRTLASAGISQPTYFKDYENAAVHRLLGYPGDELADALLELALRIVQLEQALAAASAPLSLEDFPTEQVAAFLAENERDNERIKWELEKLTPGEIKEMMLASPPLRRIRDAFAENEARRAQDRTEVG
jgi:DNA-binding XRE family transcriptional regulator